ncbi:DDE-type integrase/transposase/recombinase [Ligilactobacillus agilis]|nr:DDE-type integrase/transposase/recombinase [Ligilactobacillus agilis]
MLEAILELEEKHKWTLGYLGMTTQLAFENKLSFKVGLKRVTNCMRNHGIKANIRKKKHNRIKRHEEYINDNLLNGQFDRQNKVVMDLYGRYILSYNISATETATSAIEAFKRAFKVEPGAQPMIHTDRGAAYCSRAFNDYLAEQNCIHSMSHPGHPWENSPIERWWNDFKLVWLAKRARSKSLSELEQSVQQAIKYFNTERAYASKNGLTAEKFRAQAA